MCYQQDMIDNDREKAYEELAIAIIQSMWYGQLSQAKDNRGVYNQDSR